MQFEKNKATFGKLECLLYHRTPPIIGQHTPTVGLWNTTA